MSLSVNETFQDNNVIKNQGDCDTGNLARTFSRQGKHREFCCNTGEIFKTEPLREDIFDCIY